MMITHEQIHAAEQGLPIRVPGKIELVLVRADVYDRLTRTLDDPSETYSAVVEALGDENPSQYLEYLDEAK